MTTADEPDDWAHKLTGIVDQVTTVLRDHSVKPLTRVLRITTAAIVVALLGTVVLIAGIVGVLHLLNHDVFSGHTWVTDMLIGGIFIVGGTFVMRQGTKVRSHHG